MQRIRLLGAELQASTSYAMAWPDQRFLLVTDKPVVDGWDLPNVEFLRARVSQIPELIEDQDTTWVPLDGRWLHPSLPLPSNRLGAFDLITVLGFLFQKFPEQVLPVSNDPPQDKKWILKGDLWHRPDAPALGFGEKDTIPDDPHGCGSVFQGYLQGAESYKAIGYRKGPGEVCLAVIKVHQETPVREEFLIAVETVRDKDLVDKSFSILEALEHRGFFTMNWLKDGDRCLISSIRPVPKAVFGVLAKAGMDCRGVELSRTLVAPEGLKVIYEVTYNSYQELS